MGGRGRSIGHSQPRTCSGRKTLKKCKNLEEANDVVLIDVDSDNFDNVVIIDVTDSLPQKLQGSSVRVKDKKYPLRTIICIDDDESADNNSPGVDVECVNNLYNASSSRRSCSAFFSPQNSVDAIGDDCQFVQERMSPVRLSKCKRTYSGKAPTTKNGYGLSPEPMCDFSDAGFPDSEFMEDSSGKLREQWEKAFLKRKCDAHNGQSGTTGQASASRLHTDSHENEAENMTQQHTKATDCSNSSNASYEKENLYSFIATGDSNLGTTAHNMEKTYTNSGLRSTETTRVFCSKAGFDIGVSLMENTYFNHAGCQTQGNINCGDSGCNGEGESSQGPCLSSTPERVNRKVADTKASCQEREKSPREESCLSNSKSSGEMNFSCSKGGLQGKEGSMCSCPHSNETMVDNSRVVLDNKDEKYQQTPFSSNSHFGRSDKETSVFVDHSFQNTQPSDVMHANHDGALDGGVGATFAGTLSVGVPSESSFCHSGPNKGQVNQDHCSLERKEILIGTVPNSEQPNQNGYLLGDHVGVTDTLISEREKLKATDEYKRAVEEEWASRQRELQTQAEEAQKLRRLCKRKKAENMRLLDMERRQKQRVEEMREIQKKDEENKNFKEQLRSEVRMELSKLEMMSPDMASVLRGLGIHVGGGLHPLPHEVRVAYKRALLCFHPDRASTSDLRELVEAEEKFKLITHMKEKFLSNS